MRDGVRKVLVLGTLAVAAVSPPARAQEAPPKAARPPAAQPQPAPAARAAAAARPDPNDPRMKQLLAAWEKQSAKLKTLDVKIVRVDKSPAWGDEEYEGALLESPNHAWLDFKKVETDAQGKKKFVPHERIVCTGSEVWQFKPEVKQIFIFPLDKQNRQRALEEGPLPFLFNMKAAEAEARYEMALANEVKKYYIISVRPRLQVDQEAFSKAFLQLDKVTYLPDRIFLVSPDGTSTKDFSLVKLSPNAPIAAENFKPTDPGRPWQIVRDPVGNDPAPRTAQGAAAKRQAPAAAPRRAAVAPRRPPAN